MATIRVLFRLVRRKGQEEPSLVGLTYGQILPNNRKLIYKLDIKRVIMRKLILGIANGKVICDDNLVYELKILSRSI